MKNISKPLDVIETNYDDAFNNPPTTTVYDKSYKGITPESTLTTADDGTTQIYNGLAKILSTYNSSKRLFSSISIVRFGI